MKNSIYIFYLFIFLMLSCKNEDKTSTSKNDNVKQEILKSSENSDSESSMTKTTKEFLKSTGLSNEDIDASIKEAERLEKMFQDSTATGNVLEGLMKQGVKREKNKEREKAERKKRESGNFDDFMDAFNTLNKESGVAATIDKLKKADSLTGQDSFGKLGIDPDSKDVWSEKINVSEEKMTKEERQIIRGFTRTKRSVHSIEEIKEINKMIEQTDLDKMQESGSVTQAFVKAQKREFKKAKSGLQIKEKNAAKAQREFKRLNPELYFGDEVGMTYFGTKAAAVYLPLGKLSFADKVIDFYHPDNIKTADLTIGEPDAYSAGMNQLTNAYSLGTKGTLTIKFEDNALVDVNGPDLYVFEMGAVEPTSLEISKDGKNWILVGKIDGGTAEVDIHDFVKPNELFYYVRLTDLVTSSGIPGADVDAIAAIGSAMRLNLDSQVLFDSGKSELKPEGKDALKELAKSIEILKRGNVIVEGHTDNVGSEGTNKKLSLARAKSVSAALKKLIPNSTFKWKEIGYGKEKPLEDNDSDSNRAKNRRVEVLILPN